MIVKLSEPQRELAAAHFSQAISLAKLVHAKYQRHGWKALDLNELESAAQYGLIAAASGWDRVREFWPYASSMIWGRLRDAMRDTISRQCMSFEETINTEKEPTIWDKRPDEPLQLPDGVGADARERKVIDMRFREGLLLREIAAEFNVTEAMVSLIIKSVLTRCRVTLEDL